MPSRLQQLVQHHGFCRRMAHDAGRNRAIAFPQQFLAQRAALGRVERTIAIDHQRPAAVPAVGQRGVDAAVGVDEALHGRCRDGIRTAAAVALGAQPAFLCQSEYGGAQQTVVDAERGQQLDQAAQPDHATMGHDAVAEDGHHQRFRARRFGGEEVAIQSWQSMAVQV
jgi:hypothetical protein